MLWRLCPTPAQSKIWARGVSYTILLEGICCVKDQPIIVVGGGIGGFATALALARQGFGVKLIEQAESFSEAGAGIQLGPNIMRMFDALGVTDAINAAAVFPDMLTMRDGFSGDAIVEIPLGPDFERAFGRPYGVIFRPDLHQTLIDAALATGRVETCQGVKATGFRESSDGVVVETADGATHAGQGLVGADGLWSAIRAEIVGDGAPRVAGHIAYRAVLPIDQVPSAVAEHRVTLWAGPKTHLVTYPLRRGEIFNIVAVFHSDRYEQGWDVYGDPEELRQKFDGQHADVAAMIDRIESWRMWVLCDREPISEWSKGRATLLGDAAHPTLQYMAQGANMAVEDAVCLAHLLAESRGDLPAAFAEYPKRRYLRTARVQLTSRFYGDIFHAEGAARELRNTLLPRRSAEQAYQGMAWLYGGVDDNGCQIV